MRVGAARRDHAEEHPDDRATGCGKTEIARRRRLAGAVRKVEATKFTEVGYVGRDVDSIVKELADVAVKMAREQEVAKVRERALDAAEERVLDALLPKPRVMGFSTDEPPAPRDADTRQKFRKMLREHALDERGSKSNCARFRWASRSWRPRHGRDAAAASSMFQNLGGHHHTRKVR